jgi:2-iminobutanoate/2-iminopropanoate deaminase
MPLRTIVHPPGWAAPPGYSHAIATRGGRLLAISGQVALDAAGNLVGAGDFKAQAHQAFANLGAVLAAAGLSNADIVKVTYFVVGLDHERVLALREAREAALGGERPAASLLGVAALFRPDLLVEIEAIAEYPPQ